MSVLPKVAYRFDAIPIKASMVFFTDIGKTILKFIMEPQMTLTSQNNLEEKEQG